MVNDLHQNIILSRNWLGQTFFVQHIFHIYFEHSADLRYRNIIGTALKRVHRTFANGVQYMKCPGDQSRTWDIEPNGVTFEKGVVAQRVIFSQ